MRVILNENQYKLLIRESSEKNDDFDLESLKNFSKEVFDKFSEETGIQVKLLLTWGAAVGGIILPLNEFIENGNFGLNSFQVTSILVACATILYNENSRLINSIKNRIKEEGIEETFKIILNKGIELKQAFLDFVESLNVTIYTMTNIMSYAFLIPLLPLFWDISHREIHNEDLKRITIRLLSFGLTSVTGIFLKTLLSKIIKRFR